MAVNLSVLEPSLRIELPGILEPVLTDAITRVVRQFFWKSEAWKYVYDNGLDWTVSTAAVPLGVAGTDIPTATIVKRVDTIKYDAGGAAWDTEIPFKTRDELDRENVDWESEGGTSPSAWTINNSGEAIIIPIPSATVTTGLLIRAIIVPDTTLTALPDFLFYEFEEAFKAGVLAQLMKQPGKDWTNIQMSVFYATAFGAALQNAKSRAEASFGQPKDTMAYGGL
jgi:hypothetical protein